MNISVHSNTRCTKHLMQIIQIELLNRHTQEQILRNIKTYNIKTECGLNMYFIVLWESRFLFTSAQVNKTFESFCCS